MEILACLGLGVALLYFWLIGHWFARVLVFIGLEAIALFFLCLMSFIHPGFGLFGLFLLVAAWPLARIPTWHWQKEIRRLLRRDISPA